MRWEPITPENAVEKLRVASEHAILDFKATYDLSDPTKPFEIAKDVCAFANHLGGTIIVGVHEGTRGTVGNFARLENPNPSDLVKGVDRALGLYCRPVPVANAISIPLDEGQVKTILGRDGAATTIVAINVPPMLNTPTGCLSCVDICKKHKKEGLACSCIGEVVPDAWRFPIRRIERTEFLRPEELAKTMNVTERRALLDLQAIENEASIDVWFNSGTNFQRHQSECTIVSLNASIMVAVLQLVHIPDARAEIPMTFVRAVWRSSSGWNIAIDGSAFDGGKDREGYRPIGSSVAGVPRR